MITTIELISLAIATTALVTSLMGWHAIAGLRREIGIVDSPDR